MRTAPARRRAGSIGETVVVKACANTPLAHCSVRGGFVQEMHPKVNQNPYIITPAKNAAVSAAKSGEGMLTIADAVNRTHTRGRAVTGSSNAMRPAAVTAQNAGGPGHFRTFP